MSGEQEMSEDSGKLLILTVDRDGDLENKTKVRTPLWGREPVISAATNLAISDPEEADANALFAAIKEYDRLSSRGEDCEVAVVCGVNSSGLDADRKIRREVEALSKAQHYSGFVLVSDGAEDEQVLPILQSILPIISVVRIVVKHSRTVEETYMVLGRYLRMLVYDERYSRWVVGVPGVIFLFAGVLVLLNRAYEAGIAILLIVGATFLVRGFGIDRSVAAMLSQRPSGYLRLFSLMAAALIFLVGVSSGFSFLYSQLGANHDPNIISLVTTSPSLFLVYGSEIIGYYLEGSLILIWSAFGVYVTGSLLAHLTRGSNRVWRDGVLVVLLLLLYLPMNEFAVFLTAGSPNSSFILISYVLIGLALTFALVTGVYGRMRSSRTAALKE